jgi:NAD-dependent dihydropyrimidine dehydrogenase PreA subunit
LGILREMEVRERERLRRHQYEIREERCGCRTCERERPSKNVVEIWKRDGRMMIVRRGKR